MLGRKSILENKWLQEILIVIVLYILYTLTDWRDVPDWKQLGEASIYFILLFAHAQFQRFFTLPILLDKYKPASFALFSIVTLIVVSVALYGMSMFVFACDYFTNMPLEKALIFQLAATTVSLIGMLTPYIILRFYRQQKKQATSQLCWNHMELSLLRSQLNPHFMFNTFNNLYGISLKEPERLPDLILQVSQLMRYQLENQEKWWVPLKDELSFIESYIAIEEERVGSRCDIHYEFENKGKESYDQIAPMMLMPFIENAFKHGANSIESCFVHIRVSVVGTCLEMEIKNSIPKHLDVSQVSTGIGLENAQQRLNILYPNGKHRLKMEANSTEYKVNLSLQLYPKEYDGKIYVPDCR